MFGMRDLIPWSRGRDVAEPFQGREHPLMTMQRDMDRLFADLWRGFDAPGFARPETWHGLVSPSVDVKVDDENIVVTAELPGMEENDVEVNLTDTMLTIKGEKKAEHEETEHGRTYRERSYGSFERRIPLEAEVLADKVEAGFKNGVLTVTLPKSPKAKETVKRIPIGGSGKENKGEKKAA